MNQLSLNVRIIFKSRKFTEYCKNCQYIFMLTWIMTYVQGSAASHIIYAWRGLFTTFRTPRLNSCILFLIRHDHGKKVSMEFKGHFPRVCAQRSWEWLPWWAGGILWRYSQVLLIICEYAIMIGPLKSYWFQKKTLVEVGVQTLNLWIAYTYSSCIDFTNITSSL